MAPDRSRAAVHTPARAAQRGVCGARMMRSPFQHWPPHLEQATSCQMSTGVGILGLSPDIVRSSISHVSLTIWCLAPTPVQEGTFGCRPHVPSFSVNRCTLECHAKAPWPNGQGIGPRSWGLQVRVLPGSCRKGTCNFSPVLWSSVAYSAGRRARCTRAQADPRTNDTPSNRKPSGLLSNGHTGG